MAKMLKVGNRVKVIAGSKKGTIASIVKVDRANRKAMLKDINVVERHVRANAYQKGSKKTVHLGIDFSNLKKEDK
jgi:large subunit ribosomal protein L24